MSSLFRRFGFTLIELMVVVVVLGVIAAFAIPNYRKAVERGYEKTALTNLTLIYSKQEAIKARYGKYWPEYLRGAPTGNIGIPTLATEMGLNIPTSTDVTYVCVAGDPNEYICYAVRINGPTNWQLYVDSRIGTGNTSMPCCDPGYDNCPTMADCSMGYLF